MSRHAVRQNERLSRYLGERGGLPGTAHRIAFVCECGSDACHAPLYLTARDYETAKRGRSRYVVTSGHQIVEREAVIAVLGLYLVVEDARALAEAAVFAGKAEKLAAASPSGAAPS